jgi:hypothetical protein
MTLYWVTTEDHEEDWFILARHPRSAECYHVETEGYDQGDARAEQIMSVPKGLLDESRLPRHAQLSDLMKLGFRILSGESAARMVQLGGRTFVEGPLEQMIRTADDNLSEARGEGRPNRTRRARAN